MGATEHILWISLDINHSIDLGLPLYLLRELSTDVLEQFLQVVVEVRDIALYGGFIAIFLKYLVGGVGIHTHLVNIHATFSTRFLLHNGEDVPIKARLVYAHHIREALTKRTTENEVVSHSLQVPYVLRSPIDGGQVKVIDMAHLIGGKSYLLVVVLRQLHEVI